MVVERGREGGLAEEGGRGVMLTKKPEQQKHKCAIFH